jgi:hypothetical protein
MSQTANSRPLKDLAEWIKDQENGATVQGIRQHAQLLTCESGDPRGISNRRVERYIDALHHAGVIEYKHPYWKITGYGKACLGKE